jgi:homoserine dehydrogenase
LVNDVAPLGIVQTGLGQVGRALIGQALAASERYPWIVYRGVGDRSGLVWRPQGWTPQELTDLLRAKDAGLSLRQYWNGRGAAEGVFVNERFDRGAAIVQPLAAAVAAGEDVALVDVTAERNAYAATLAARQAGAHVVLCNKWALAEDQARYDALLQAGPGRLQYETTVGAALPVLGVLDNLLRTGDEVTEIQAAISGTLGYVTSAIERGVPFSVALREAQALGYSEPDPRDDLGGIDARRKALILARKLGMRLDMADVAAASLVPEGLERTPLDAFWEGLRAQDADYAARVAAAAARGAALRFLAVINREGARVGLVEAPLDGLAGSLRGTESLFVFKTRRYGDQPLAVRGRGAGADLTASGVLADILAIHPERAARVAGGAP